MRQLCDVPGNNRRLYTHPLSGTTVQCSLKIVPEHMLENSVVLVT